MVDSDTLVVDRFIDTTLNFISLSPRTKLTAECSLLFELEWASFGAE